MTDTCPELMRRVPVALGVRQEAHAHLQLCGRPVVADGLCGYHLRHRERPFDERGWRRKLRTIRRGG